LFVKKFYVTEMTALTLRNALFLLQAKTRNTSASPAPEASCGSRQATRSSAVYTLLCAAYGSSRQASSIASCQLPVASCQLPRQASAVESPADMALVGPPSHFGRKQLAHDLTQNPFCTALPGLQRDRNTGLELNQVAIS
jgi:hypothetical protein